MKKINININGAELEACAGQTILEAARDNGIFIPTLCEDSRTEIYGACGICVVEVENNPKLVKACATELADGMIVRTDTPRVIDSRKTMLELLLSNHSGDCRGPCRHACPAGTDCQGYVGLTANGQMEEAYRLIIERIPLPASIGRVCPHPCETDCRRGLVEEPVAIAGIKRFCGDYALEHDPGAEWMPKAEEETGKQVAIIGGGPYGLSLAYFLRLLGHGVTIFEAMPKAGGMLRYGIPEYRLPKAILDAEIERLESLGIKIKTGRRVGRDVTMEHIREKYDAVCLGVGAWVSTGANVKGEDLPGVVGGMEMLRKVAAGEDVYLGERVAVMGGGNTAMDACRTAVRMGAKVVYSVYRRTKNEMPAEEIEVVEAAEEGVIFKELTNPIEFFAGRDGRVEKVKLQHMKLGEPDDSGRRSPSPIEGKTEMLDVDTVVIAIGQAPDPVSLGLEGLDLTRRKGVSYDPKTFATSVPGVFAGGDCGNDKVSIAVEAIGDAKKSAGLISAYLSGERIEYKPAYSVKKEGVDASDYEEYERIFRPKAKITEPEERKRSFAEISAGWNEEEIVSEAARCLECGCADYFECKLIEYARLYDVEPERYKGELSAVPDRRDEHPFIEREEGKCILCGLCVRICEEVCGAAALGFAGRGFDNVVTPEFGIGLSESACVSCGLCVDSCPTGAMREKLAIKKSVPLETRITETTCPHCGLGCPIALETRGELLVKANPSKDEGGRGLICGRGKFGFDCSEVDIAGLGERLRAPLVRDGSSGGLMDATWYDAFVATAKKAQSVRARYGPGSVAVAISDRLTNEEAYAARSLALTLGARVFSFNNRVSAASALYGAPASADLTELRHTDVVLSVCLDFAANPVLAMELDHAAGAGVRLIKIETGDANETCECGKKNASFGSRIKGETIHTSNNLRLLSEIEAALKNKKTTAKAAKIADDIRNARKVMFVYQRNVVTADAAALICRIALLSGHGSGPRDGVFEILPKCNSGGLYDLEIGATAVDIVDSDFGAEVKALLIFGEDPAGQIQAAGAGRAAPDELKAAKKLLDQVVFLAVCDTHNTATAGRADVVIPMSGFASADGTYTNTEGRLLAVNPAAESGILYKSWQVCKEIANILGADLSWESEADISREMNNEVPAYRDAVIGGTRARPDAAALPDAPETKGKLVSPLPSSDHLTRSVNSRLGTSVYGV